MDGDEVCRGESAELLLSVTDVARRHLEAGRAPALDDPDADLAAVGFDSLVMVEFLLDLEASLGIEFPADSIDGETFRSLRSVANSVRTLRKQQAG